MARKKLSELTPIEKSDRILKGSTWEEAEEAGVEIFARCLSVHVYVREEKAEDYLEHILKRICERAYEWKNENAGDLAMTRVGLKIQKGNL